MDSDTRHYIVRPSADAPSASWSITCEGRELAALPEREAAVDLATKVARADADEFGTTTEVLVDDGEATVIHACFGARTRLS